MSYNNDCVDDDDDDQHYVDYNNLWLWNKCINNNVSLW